MDTAVAVDLVAVNPNLWLLFNPKKRYNTGVFPLWMLFGNQEEPLKKTQQHGVGKMSLFPLFVSVFVGVGRELI